MKQGILLAPKNLKFDEAKHEYFLDGKILSGVTGKIAERLNLRMPEEWVGEARNEGVHIHKAVQNWIDGRGWESIHPGALWVKGVLEKVWASPEIQCHAEVLVSDGERYASSVDIIGSKADGYVLYDIKRTFKRPYVTWQLSVYKYFIEQFAKASVSACYCIAVKDRAVYPIQPYGVKDVKELLYGKEK